MMATAVLFHYINRMANIFLDTTMMPLIGHVPLVRTLALRVFTAMESSKITAIKVLPGAFLTGVPERELPCDFSWALPNPAVAGALLRFSAAVEDAAGQCVPSGIRDQGSGIRELVCEQVDNWNGAPFGPGRAPISAALARLPAGMRPQAALCLQAALASWSVDGAVIRSFRAVRSDDRALLVTAAFGAYLAAKRSAGMMN